MSECALDIPEKEVCTSFAPERGANMTNVITLSSHPLWQDRELTRLVKFLRDNKPDSYWHGVLYERGEPHGERAKAWIIKMILSGAFSGEKILDLARNVAPWVYTIEYREQTRKTLPPLPDWIFKSPKRQ